MVEMLNCSDGETIRTLYVLSLKTMPVPPFPVMLVYLLWRPYKLEIVALVAFPYALIVLLDRLTNVHDSTCTIC